MQVGLGRCHGGLYFFLLLTLLPISAAWAQNAGEVISALGSLEVLRDGRWQPITTGAWLAAGDTVRTGEGSRAAIQFINGIQIKINAHSELELKAIAPSAEGFLPTTIQTLRSVLRVLSGDIWVRNSGEPLDIQTVPATATIRGTEFTLSVSRDQSACLAVLSGLVEFHNEQGRVWVAAHEQADVNLGEAPRKSVLLNPLDAVQWSFYYSGLNEIAVSDPNYRPDPNSTRYWTQTAQNHLLRGQAAEARQALDRALAIDPQDALAYSLRSNIELVQNRKVQAREDAERAITADPHSVPAWLSLSLVKQAEFDLDGALAAAQQAVKLEPENARSLVQESSLLFGMGRLKEAVKRAKQAKQRAPNDAFVNTIWGFLQLARYRTEDAREAFQQAIQQDSTLGLPHLGLGLVWFKQKDSPAALAEMRKATLLDPQISLYNSYLGKAFYEAKDQPRAKKYLNVAKQLDPRDPTPHLYDAMRLQSINQPIAAVEELQKSIELNDNRAVYRSRLLLDQDLATRSAALGQLYNEVGFTQLGLQEGWQSVSRDPASDSAHRLLSDAYSTQPQAEIARVSELLQTQLFQPINVTPVQPQQAETKLMIPNAGPMTPSLYEFNSLFVRGEPTLSFSGLSGNNNTWGDDVIVSGMAERFSYSFGQSHYQSNGYRENNDLTNDLYNVFVQAVAAPNLTLQVEYRHRETSNGDLRSYFDGLFSHSRRRNLDQDTARVGAHYTLSPQTHIIASVIDVDRNEVVDSPIFDSAVGLRQKGARSEAQVLHKEQRFNWIAGLGTYSIDNFFSGVQQPNTTESQTIAYGYANIAIPKNLIWTVGLSYESDESQNAHLNGELNPKFGIQWALNDRISLRAAAFKVVKPSLAIDQTIEPTQVAGFNQFFDNIGSTVSQNYAAGLDIQLHPKLFGGVNALQRNLDAPFGTLGVPQFYEVEQQQIHQYGAYLYWMPDHQWAIKASWLYEKFEVEEGLFGMMFARVPAQLTTNTLPLDIRYFDPSGFFAGIGVVYVNQEIQVLDQSSLTFSPTQSENFTLFNVGLGYRLPKRWGIVALQVNNVFDEKFRFQDNSFMTADQSINPLYFPERTVYGRLTFSF